ncbi:hypothetical protein KSS94_11410 [Pseudomonas fakonensis]|uniref:Uncharacterized protein n=1 Tax=Pseudomonas fakonensis TaxID=2842355 RepID=A0ABX8ND31_9PSED|nr:hypothetical protein [Pseudomonas fakonensis]QXH53681.1 hypothetical protein KSS94_11410 [Pseudomonas fakonensis]
MAVVDEICNRTAINVLQALPLLVVNTTIGGILSLSCFCFPLLTALKADAGKLPKNFHGRMLDDGDYVGKVGEVIGNIRDYLP